MKCYPRIFFLIPNGSAVGCLLGTMAFASVVIWVRYKSQIYILNSRFIADPATFQFHTYNDKLLQLFNCTPPEVSLKMTGTVQAYLCQYIECDIFINDKKKETTKLPSSAPP